MLGEFDKCESEKSNRPLLDLGNDFLSIVPKSDENLEKSPKRHQTIAVTGIATSSAIGKQKQIKATNMFGMAKKGVIHANTID